MHGLKRRKETKTEKEIKSTLFDIVNINGDAWFLWHKGVECDLESVKHLCTRTQNVKLLVRSHLELFLDSNRQHDKQNEKQPIPLRTMFREENTKRSLKYEKLMMMI